MAYTKNCKGCQITDSTCVYITITMEDGKKSYSCLNDKNSRSININKRENRDHKIPDSL